jgi:hypothetical protein
MRSKWTKLLVLGVALGLAVVGVRPAASLQTCCSNCSDILFLCYDGCEEHWGPQCYGLGNCTRLNNCRNGCSANYNQCGMTCNPIC